MQLKPEIANLPAYKPPKLIGRLSSDTIKLSSNENPLGPSPKALAALQEALARVHRYPDAASTGLREALAARYDLAPEMVVCGNGSDELVMLLCLGLLHPGDEAVMAEGTFISYMLRTLELAGRPVRVPLRDYTHDLDAMAEAIGDRTRLLFICNPNNPTGTSNGAEEIARLLERVPDHVLVVMDEAYCEFAERPDYPDLLPLLRAGRRNIILLRTFAKIHGLAGLRLGYGFAHPELVAYLDKARPTFNINSLAQAAGSAALDDDEHVARSRTHAQAERSFFQVELARLGIQPAPSETNFVAFSVGDDLAVTQALRERGFTVTPLGGWGVPGCIRVSFGLRAENERFIAALREVLGPAGNA
jgi:histidinol-phosphate aminotransferase